MGNALHYCQVCGVRISAQDVERGVGLRISGQMTCVRCAPSLVGSISPEDLQAILRKGTGRKTGGDGAAPVSGDPPNDGSSRRAPILHAVPWISRGETFPSRPLRPKRALAIAGILVGLAAVAAAIAGVLLPGKADLRREPPPAAQSTLPLAPPQARVANAPAPIGRAAEIIRELEQFVRSSPRPEVLLGRCEDAGSLIKGTPFEPRLREIEGNARICKEKEEGNERKARLDLLLAEIRELQAADSPRRGDLLVKLAAALEIAGPRRGEVEKLKADCERLIRDASAAAAPLAAKPAPPLPPVENPSPAAKVNRPPSVEIAMPAGGASLPAPATVRILAQAFDADGVIARVEFFAGDAKLGQAVVSPFEFTWKDVPAGEYRLTALATDDRGATTTSSPVSIAVTPPVAAMPDSKDPPAKLPESKKEREAIARKAIEDFKGSLRDAKTVEEKALAVQELGNCPVKDPVLVPHLARFLIPTSQDINFILPLVAAEALGGFREDASAARALMQGLEACKKCPYPAVGQKMFAGVARVGHESAIPIFQEHLKSGDVNRGRQALGVMRAMPPALALETVFGAWDSAQKETVPGKYSGPLDPLQQDLAAFVRAVSGEPYKTMPELRHWWKIRGAAFEEKAAAAEMDLPPPAHRAGLPAAILVELPFNEDFGTDARNTGSSAGLFGEARITSPKPARVAGPRGKALDWGKEPGSYAVDLGGVIEHLKNLKSFTIMGWLNCGAKEEGRGGNRVLTWLNNGRDGVELVWRADGSLQLGVNEWAHESAARSEAGQVPPLGDAKAPNAIRNNWRFFAVTYDSTLPSGQVKFYLAASIGAPKLVATRDYARGPVGAYIGPSLSVGHVHAATRGVATDQMFRGMIDQIRVIGSAFDGSGAVPLEEITNHQKG